MGNKKDRSAEGSRRHFLARSGALATAGYLAPAELLSAEKPGSQPKSKTALKRIGVVTTVYRPMSHSYHICRRFLDGFHREGVHYQPNFTVTRMYIDQYPGSDIGRRDAKLQRRRGRGRTFLS